MKQSLTLVTALLLAPPAALYAADSSPVHAGYPATMSALAQPARRSPRAPKYEEICLSPRTTSAGGRDVNGVES